MNHQGAGFTQFSAVPLSLISFITTHCAALTHLIHMHLKPEKENSFHLFYYYYYYWCCYHLAGLEVKIVYWYLKMEEICLVCRY